MNECLTCVWTSHKVPLYIHKRWRSLRLLERPAPHWLRWITVPPRWRSGQWRCLGSSLTTGLGKSQTHSLQTLWKWMKIRSFWWKEEPRGNHRNAYTWPFVTPVQISRSSAAFVLARPLNITSAFAIWWLRNNTWILFLNIKILLFILYECMRKILCFLIAISGYN